MVIFALLNLMYSSSCQSDKYEGTAPKPFTKNNVEFTSPAIAGMRSAITTPELIAEIVGKNPEKKIIREENLSIFTNGKCPSKDCKVLSVLRYYK